MLVLVAVVGSGVEVGIEGVDLEGVVGCVVVVGSVEVPGVSVVVGWGEVDLEGVVGSDVEVG